jgi:hypothetical protein
MKPPDEPEQPLSPGILSAGGVIESRVRSHQACHIILEFRLYTTEISKWGGTLHLSCLVAVAPRPTLQTQSTQALFLSRHDACLDTSTDELFQ